MIRAKQLSAVESAEPGDKSLLKQRAYAQLKQLIQDATFRPGDFLSERQLASRLGMSKTPVKAALERLEAEGFIAVAPQQGIVVREVSLQEIADQFEIRAALESFVLRAVAGKLAADEVQRVRHNLELQCRAVAEHDVPRSVELDTEFHMLFCDFLGNREIIRVMTQLREKIHRAISRVFRQNAERLASSYDEHEAIASAVIAGDADLAVTRLEQHLNYGKQFLLAPRRR
jgi:DNA-binding GntR family transcriptional regulator